MKSRILASTLLIAGLFVVAIAADAKAFGHHGSCCCQPTCCAAPTCCAPAPSCCNPCDSCCRKHHCHRRCNSCCNTCNSCCASELRRSDLRCSHVCRSRGPELRLRCCPQLLQSLRQLLQQLLP